MSIIKVPLLFAGSLGQKHIYTLHDSGRCAAATNLSCIHPDQVADLEMPRALGRTRMIGTAAEGHSGGVPYIEVTHRVSLDFYMNDVLLSDEFLVIPGLSEDAIIGAATMQNRTADAVADKVRTVRRRGLSMTSPLLTQRLRKCS